MVEMSVSLFVFFTEYSLLEVFISLNLFPKECKDKGFGDIIQIFFDSVEKIGE